MRTSTSVYVIGDIHGQFKKLVRLLREAGLVDDALAWAGGEAALWFLGDFFDRGSDGVAVVDLVMRLQAEAAAAGGQVGALLGNHEVLTLAAHRFGERETIMLDGSFLSVWRRNGGRAKDLIRLTQRHITWMTNLPAMALAYDRLFVHADATFYTNYGHSIAMVNWACKAVLQSAEVRAWERLLYDFCEREAFDGQRVDGAGCAAQFLHIFGGRQLIHGHTPIAYITQIPPKRVTDPLVYAGGLCINLDGGMYLGGPGFVYQLPQLDATRAQRLVPAGSYTDQE